MNESAVLIRSSRLSDAASVREAVNAIAAEKWYLATIDGFSLKETRAYLKLLVETGSPHVVAIVQDKVVGFCDILHSPVKGFTHVGRLGMGVRREWRRQGVGRRLIEACLSLGRTAGLEKIELEVFSDNVGAVRLYETCGFKREGVKARGRKLEGRYQDVILMALWV